MRKLGVFSISVFITIIIAGLYGILHDQVTYSISHEYFTKFKYRQFGFDQNMWGGHRQTVAAIGFLATWWMGLFISIMIGLLGLVFKDHIGMKKSIIKAIMIVFITSISFAFSGYLWGKYHLVKTGVNWWMPDNLNNKNDFIIVGSIHNFSYLGGITGLVFAIIFMLMKIRNSRNKHETT